MRRDGRTYVPLSTRLADFGRRDGRTGGAARAMKRLLHEGAREAQATASSPLARALQSPQGSEAESPQLHGPSDPSSSMEASLHETAIAPTEIAVPDLETRLAAAREEGFAAGLEEGMARARAEADARIAALEKAHAEELSTRERLWADRLAAELAGRLQEGFRHLARRLEEAVADVLAPLVQEAVREQALADLAATLVSLSEEGLRIQVKGPSHLIEALKARLPDCPLETEMNEEMADIHVHLADAVIETRLAEWQARLAEAMTAAASSTVCQAGSPDGCTVTDGETAS